VKRKVGAGVRASLALATALGAGSPAQGATPSPALLLFGNESVAAADGASGFAFNPAAAGLRYPSELLLSASELEPSGRIVRAQASVEGFGLGLSHDRDHSSAFHLGLGGGADELRIGFATTWLRDGPSGDRATDLRLGALSRPAPWLSMGATADHVAQPTLAGSRLGRAYGLGLGLRPLALDRARAHEWGPRLSLTADAALAEDRGPKQARLRFGAELELAPGLLLRGAAEDHGGVQLGVALLGTRAGYHAQGAFDRDRRRRYATHSISLHDGEDRTAFAGRIERRVATLSLGGALADESLRGASLLGGGATVSTGPIHEQLERAARDPLTRGVLLELGGISGMAQIEELRPRIERLRALGKPVVAYLPYGGTRGDLFLASACDRVVAADEGMFSALGLRAERRFYRRLLASLGIRMDRTAYGAYKSAYSEYSDDSTSTAEREEIGRILDVAQGLFVDAVSRDRHVAPERLLTLLDGRSWPPSELVKAGLVDSLGDRADAQRVLGRLVHLGDRPRAVDLGRVAEARRDWTVPTRIAVVVASGDMAEGESGNDLLFGPTLGAETLIEQLEAAFHDASVEAVVLRVESPGGFATAAGLMHQATRRLKRETGKPLIVSMGRVAASGGYYLSADADRIFADRYTYTGSIGVVFTRPSLEGFYAKHHVRQEAFERGDYMRGLSIGEDWDRALQASADSATRIAYRRFVAKVAEGRKLGEAAVDSVAQGRVWMGEDARARGLVDEIGGLEEAIAEARRRAGIPDGEKIDIARYGRPEASLLQRVVGAVVKQPPPPSLRLLPPPGLYYWDDVEEAP
jgi:protease-4